MPEKPESAAPDVFGACRDTLERLDAAFPGRELLTRTEVAKWLGVHRNTVTRKIGRTKGKISKIQVARSLAVEEERRQAGDA